MEKAKDLAARKLEETADDREQADRLAGGNQPRFRGGVAPQDLEDRIRAEQEHLAQVIEQMQRRQMDWMNQRQSEFLGRMGPRSGFPSGFGTGRPFMTPFPGFPPMLGFNGMPQPGGGGDGARFRRFQGPGGMRGFEMHWGGQAGAQPRDDPPPPPQPRDGPIFD